LTDIVVRVFAYFQEFENIQKLWIAFGRGKESDIFRCMSWPEEVVLTWQKVCLLSTLYQDVTQHPTLQTMGRKLHGLPG